MVARKNGTHAKSRTSLSGPEITMEKADGRTLRVARWRCGKGENPSGALPLLFFNGIGANMEAVAPFAELLTERPFIMFDMPGTGGSPEPSIPYNAIMMARITNKLLNRFGIDKVDVMGVSWGGAMAQHFALQHSARVRKVILAATTAGMFMVPGNIKALSKMANPRRYIDPDYMNTHFATLYGGSTEGSADHVTRITPPTKRGYFYQVLAMLGWTSAPFLPFLKKPVLILMGSDDQIVVPFNGKILNTLIPGSKLRIIDGGGHLFMLSHADESLEYIREFLDDGAMEKARAA